MTISGLPDFPATATRKSLSPSQLATLNQTIATRLQETLALPPEKRDTQASRRFVASFAQDTALQTLQPLIWENPSEPSAIEKSIRHRALLLAEKLASGLELQTLLDLAIIYSKSRTRLRKIFEQSTPPLLPVIQDELIPAFTAILGDSSTGLYGIRKSTYCIVSFLRVATEEVIRSFYHSKQFVLALARCYDQGLAAMAQSYGGLRMTESRDLDDWERIFIETKVDIIDSFHIILSSMLRDLSSASGRALAAESERTFDTIFALLDVGPSSSDPRTPFLNRPLLADYQQSYDLSRTLASALRHASEKDARLDLLESSLKSLEGEGEKGPGVLKLIIRSSGVPPGVDNRGKSNNDKGKGKAAPPPEITPSDPNIDLKVSQVLDIFPDYPPDYISTLLTHPSYPYRGNPEKLIEALLEGTAPPEDDVPLQISQPSMPSNELVYTKGRQNVFDDEKMDLTQLRLGKKREDETAIMRDRTFMEQMKADILRRAEEISDEEDDEEGTTGAFDEEDLGSTVKVGGDGEESDEDGAEGVGEIEAAPVKQLPETIVELAYIQDPKQFDRDANTRRSKGRADLKAQTGWSDEQIEGWWIMLERNPKKDKILQKHEFAGNQHTAVPAQSNRGGGPSRGAGRGRGRGRGRGGGSGSGGGGGEQQSRDRAWKDKNKASRGNHNRKRGHDKKMARGGGPS
ncbi:hypothetical protein EV421DRAFT_1702375 [Armillaria borealis]|uniref:CUE domain-containing protein n=1 Tax=Armillaria borealis TaxID=47425 RepID=A0AA39K2Y9_9AGAR|nr:hypothetical protein EV421DRAFT_1702375 [Armillaria borealis]